MPLNSTVSKKLFRSPCSVKRCRSQRNDIFMPVPQRRDINPHHLVQSASQIFEKIRVPRLHGDNHPNIVGLIRRDILGTDEKWFDLTAIKDTKQVRLQGSY